MSACVTSDEQRDPVLDHVDAVVTDAALDFLYGGTLRWMSQPRSLNCNGRLNPRLTRHE